MRTPDAFSFSILDPQNLRTPDDVQDWAADRIHVKRRDCGPSHVAGPVGVRIEGWNLEESLHRFISPVAAALINSGIIATDGDKLIDRLFAKDMGKFESDDTAIVIVKTMTFDPLSDAYA